MGIERKFKREALKRQYKKFCKAWGNEKAYQAYLLEQGEELGQPKLGRKPTFKQWCEMMENVKKKTKASAPAEKVETAPEEDIPDLEWEEDNTGGGP